MSLPLRRIAPILLMSLLAAIAAPLTATAAGASPIDDKKAEAARLAAAIDANGEKISALDEQRNAAQLKLQDAQSQIATAKQQIEQAQQQADALKAVLGQRAASIYTDATSPGGSSSLNDPITAAARSTYAAAAASKNDGMISQLTVIKEQLAQKKADFEAAQAEAQAQNDQLAAAAKQAATLQANQEQLLSQTKGQLAALVTADQQRRDAAAKAAALAAIQRAAARSTSTRSGASAPKIDTSKLPPPSGRAAAAISFAYAQLGKPYVYAATGLASYDCSGLTMRAWGAAGVSLPHYSGAQYSMFPKVPLSQLQPGDLVFRGAGGSQHVSLYIGGGQVISAPHTGDVVKVQGMGNVLPYGSRPG
ncbi:MAG: cell wall-associated hydrolase, invasion-associated protein [Actinomycetia bacterium]|nr:cell wall-associated hydrolase, invasion-associated protein [Actinomycetes bacterium]